MRRVVKGVQFTSERYRIVTLPERGPEEHLAASDEPMGVGPGWEAADAYSTPQIDAGAEVDAARERARAILQEAQERALAIVDEAQARAERMIDEAASSSAALREQARQAGHDSGYAEGLGAAQEQTADSVAALRTVVETAQAERRALIEAAEPEIVRLAMTVAARVVHREIETDPRVVVDVARAAIARLADKETMVVRVNPADLETMRASREELFAGDSRQIRFVGDLRVDRGGVVIDTEAGSVDAKIEHQLREARKVLRLDEEEISLDRQVSPSGVVGHAEAS